MVRVQINNEFLDNKELNNFALTLGVGDIGQINSRQGSFTTSFKIPSTKKNNRLLGFPNLVNNNNLASFVTNKLDCIVYQGGNILISGFLRIKDYDSKKKEYSATFFGDNVDWFEEIKDKSLLDIDYTRFNHNWNEAEIINSWTNTWQDGYIYPIINYGDKTSTTNWTVDQFPVAIFNKQIVKLIFEDIGYTVTGSFWDNNVDFEKDITPYSGNDYSSNAVYLDKGEVKRQNQFYSQGYINGTELLAGAEEKILFEPLSEDFLNAGFFDSIRYDYVAQQYVVARDFLYNVDSWWVQRDGAAPSDINRIRQTDVFFKINGVEQPSGNYNLVQGDTVEWFIRNNGPDDLEIETFFLPNGYLREFYMSGQIDVANQFVVGDDVSISAAIPDINQGDFIKDVLFRYGVFVQTDFNAKEVSLFTLDDIVLKIPQAVNWGDKLDLKDGFKSLYGNNIKGYGRVNKIEYQEDDKDDKLTNFKSKNGFNLGRGDLVINNEFYTGEKTLYTSPFAPTTTEQTANQFDYQCPYIPNNQDDGLKPRTLRINGLYSLPDIGGPASITIGATSGIDEVAHAWFILYDLGNGNELTGRSLWYEPFVEEKKRNFPNDSLLIRNYETIRELLNNPVLTRAKFKLNDVDILNLDFSVPVYLPQTHSYYYINKITQYKADGSTTRVELIKIA